MAKQAKHSRQEAVDVQQLSAYKDGLFMGYKMRKRVPTTLLRNPFQQGTDSWAAWEKGFADALEDIAGEGAWSCNSRAA